MKVCAKNHTEVCYDNTTFYDGCPVCKRISVLDELIVDLKRDVASLKLAVAAYEAED